MVRTCQWIGLLLVAAALVGCGGGRPQKTYTVKATTGVDQARAILQNYAKGQPVGSEVTTFPGIVEEVRKTDPVKARLLEKGFTDLEKARSGRAQKAKELLSKL